MAEMTTTVNTTLGQYYIDAIGPAGQLVLTAKNALVLNCTDGSIFLSNTEYGIQLTSQGINFSTPGIINKMRLTDSGLWLDNITKKVATEDYVADALAALRNELVQKGILTS
jgi:hypothetical protein